MRNLDFKSNEPKIELQKEILSCIEILQPQEKLEESELKEGKDSLFFKQVMFEMNKKKEDISI